MIRAVIHIIIIITVVVVVVVVVIHAYMYWIDFERAKTGIDLNSMIHSVVNELNLCYVISEVRARLGIVEKCRWVGMQIYEIVLLRIECDWQQRQQQKEHTTSSRERNKSTSEQKTLQIEAATEKVIPVWFEQIN